MELQARFGGKIRVDSEEGERSLYRWSVSGPQAAAAMRDLAPHLVVKRIQAKLILFATMLEPGVHRDGIEGQIRALKHFDYVL